VGGHHINVVSEDIAQRDIGGLVARGVLMSNQKGGQSKG
jgi:hypothetical protein